MWRQHPLKLLRIFSANNPKHSTNKETQVDFSTNTFVTKGSATVLHKGSTSVPHTCMILEGLKLASKTHNQIALNGSLNTNERADFRLILDDIANNTKRDAFDDMHGCLVITNSKEQAMINYTRIKSMVDPNSDLRISRLGSVSFVIPHVSMTARQPNTPQSKLSDISIDNMAKATNWNKLDVLICTINQLEDVLKSRAMGHPRNLNPKWIILEDYEIMFNRKEKIEAIRTVLRQFLGTVKATMKEYNARRKVYILSDGSSYLHRSLIYLRYHQR